MGKKQGKQGTPSTLKIGLLGGTFDPIHLTHLHMAEVVKDECELDEVWFVPAYEPPHKQAPQATGHEDRMDMLQQAVDNVPYFKVCTIEYEREGVSYTINTVKELKKHYPQHQFYFVIGADMVEQLPSWEGIDELVKLITFIGVGRPQRKLRTDPRYQPFIERVDMVPSFLSSSLIRERKKEGKTIRYLVPEQVYRYIEERRLYEE